ncbi:Cytochrome P450 26C1, partial [Eschrichtius robustus]|nr:Cytochrome P450 26C1 [Eschrichtius robustus]
MVWDWSTYLADYGQPASKYLRVNPNTALTLLEKIKDTSKKNNIFAQFRKNDRDKQKLIETVVKQLRSLVNGEHCALPAPQLLRLLRSERPGPSRLAMFPWGLSCLSVLGAAGTALLCAGLLLSLAQHLWTLRWTLSRDRASALPLPKGSMGWPFFGETLHWLVQGSRFHSSRRERYGTVFKTHLLGRPVIRVSGAENVRTILLGEHRLVRSQWPQSAHILLGSHTLLGAVGEPHRQRRKILARVFNRAALERYVPRLQGALRREVRSWCATRGPVAVYEAAKALTFRMAARILLGLRLDEAQCSELSRTFEQFVENLFSLPLDVPFSGLRKGIRARDQLHRHLEEAIAEKLHEDKAAAEPGDALDGIIHSTRELGHELSVQELKHCRQRCVVKSAGVPARLLGLVTAGTSSTSQSLSKTGTVPHRIA